MDGRKVVFFLALAGVAGILVVLAKSFMAISVPFEFTQFWTSHGSVSEWLWTAKWWLLFGAVSTFGMAYLQHRQRERMRNDGGLGGMLAGLQDSFNGATLKIALVKFALAPVSGFLGEVFARWIGFFVVIILVQFFNGLLFESYTSFGLFHFLQNWVFGYISDFASLRLMTEYVHNPALWAVGFAVFSCSIRTDENHHSYAGLSPFLAFLFNLFLFYMMFTYGIWASIVVHFTWDLLLGGIGFGFAAYEIKLAAQRDQLIGR